MKLKEKKIQVKKAKLKEEGGGKNPITGKTAAAH